MRLAAHLGSSGCGFIGSFCSVPPSPTGPVPLVLPGILSIRYRFFLQHMSSIAAQAVLLRQQQHLQCSHFETTRDCKSLRPGMDASNIQLQGTVATRSLVKHAGFGDRQEGCAPHFSHRIQETAAGCRHPKSSIWRAHESLLQQDACGLAAQHSSR